MKYIVFILFFSSFSFGKIPTEFQGDIKADIDEWHIIERIGYSTRHMNMLFHRYIDYLAKIHKKTAGKDFYIDEVVQEIKRQALGTRSLNRNVRAVLEYHLFENDLIPFVVSHYEEEGEGITKYAITGLRSATLDDGSSISANCLSLETTENSNVMSITWVGTKNAICPLPAKPNLGNYLLNLAESLAKAKGMSAIKLNDASWVTAKPSNITVSLKNLYTFRCGQTWYNAHGYYSAKGREHDLAIGAHARHFCLKRIDEIFTKLDMNKDDFKNELLAGKSPDTRNRIENYYRSLGENKVLLQRWIEQFRHEQIQHKAQECLGDFFWWLWNQCPESYQNIESFLLSLWNDLVLPLEYREELNLMQRETLFIKIITPHG